MLTIEAIKQIGLSVGFYPDSKCTLIKVDTLSELKEYAITLTAENEQLKDKLAKIVDLCRHPSGVVRYGEFVMVENVRRITEGRE